MKTIRIKSQREGFRRCGIAHSTQWVEYPEGTFTEEQIKILKAEPMLWVEEGEKKESKEAEGEEKPKKKGIFSKG
jgi:hypothetical protein